MRLYHIYYLAKTKTVIRKLLANCFTFNHCYYVYFTTALIKRTPFLIYPWLVPGDNTKWPNEFGTLLETLSESDIQLAYIDITYVALKSQQQETATLPMLLISRAIAHSPETPPTTPLYKKIKIELICNTMISCSIWNQ